MTTPDTHGGKMTDMINPDHYRGDRQFEPIEVIEDWGLGYHLGNALKYISRNRRKPNEDPVEGLRKAIWYLEREIKLIEALGDIEEEEVPFEGESYPDSFYEELIYYGQTVDEKEAWSDQEDFSTQDWVDFWQDDTYDLYASDSNVFLQKRNDLPTLSGKDLSKFEGDQVVSTYHVNGKLYGITRNGDSIPL